MNPPFFSVLLPAYNAAQTLPRALDSLRDQTFSDWECLIVDDGSLDDTAKKAGEYAHNDNRIHLYKRPHAGVMAARIYAMRRARGRYWVRLDADDRWLPEAFEHIAAFADAHPDAQIISVNGWQVWSRMCTAYYPQALFQTEVSLTIGDMLKGNMIGTSVVATPEVYCLAAPLRTDLYSEDPYIWLRAVARGAIHRHLPHRLHCYYRDNPQALTKDIRRIWKSHILIWRSLLDDRLLSPRDALRAWQNIVKTKLKLCIHWDAWGTSWRLQTTRRLLTR